MTHFSVFAREPILEYDQSTHPFRRELLSTPFELENGMLNIPNGKGLGIEVNLETIKKYTTN